MNEVELLSSDDRVTRARARGRPELLGAGAEAATTKTGRQELIRGQLLHPNHCCFLSIQLCVYTLAVIATRRLQLIHPKTSLPQHPSSPSTVIMSVPAFSDIPKSANDVGLKNCAIAP